MEKDTIKEYIGVEPKQTSQMYEKPRQEEVHHKMTVLGVYLRISGVLSAIIIFFEGVSLTALRSVSGESVAEAYYQSIGVFMIGLSLFICPLLWGLANLVERK